MNHRPGHLRDVPAHLEVSGQLGTTGRLAENEQVQREDTGASRVREELGRQFIAAPVMASPAACLPRSRPATPKWSRILDTFYADSFDARSRESLVEAMEDFGEFLQEDQAFHQAHLAYRNAQALGDVHATLLRSEGLLRGAAPADLAMLRHLPGIRKALVVLAKEQEEMLELMDAGNAGVRGEEEAGDEPDEAYSDDSFAARMTRKSLRASFRCVRARQTPARSM